MARARAAPPPSRRALPPSLPGVEWIAGRSRRSGGACTRSWPAPTPSFTAPAPCAARGARDFDRINAEGAGRVARGGRRPARCAAIPADVVAGGADAATVGLCRQQAARRRRGQRLRRRICAGRCCGRPPCTVRAIASSLPLFRWIARGVAPLPASRRGRFSLLHVDDLASGGAALARGGRAATAASSSSMTAVPAATIGTRCSTSRRACCERAARCAACPFPPALLRMAATANLAAARLLGYAPMLTPGKVREITHPDWLCDSHDFALATGWRAAVGLEAGLARAYGRQDAWTP